jgi:pyruvate dehydrogenase E1 component alpha subunit
MKEAMEYARSGKGPILIEFVTWREGPHTTSDNPRIYRTEKEEEEAEKWEPFHRIEKYLNDKNILNKKEKEKIWKEKLEEVKKAFQESLQELENIKINDVFDYTYEKLTPELKEQKEECINYFEGIK